MIGNVCANVSKMSLWCVFCLNNNLLFSLVDRLDTSRSHFSVWKLKHVNLIICYILSMFIFMTLFINKYIHAYLHIHIRIHKYMYMLSIFESQIYIRIWERRQNTHNTSFKKTFQSVSKLELRRKANKWYLILTPNIELRS